MVHNLTTIHITKTQKYILKKYVLEEMTDRLNDMKIRIPEYILFENMLKDFFGFRYDAIKSNAEHDIKSNERNGIKH